MTLSPGCEKQQFIWEVIPGSTRRVVRKREREGEVCVIAQLTTVDSWNLPLWRNCGKQYRTPVSQFSRQKHGDSFPDHYHLCMFSQQRLGVGSLRSRRGVKDSSSTIYLGADREKSSQGAVMWGRQREPALRVLITGDLACLWHRGEWPASSKSHRRRGEESTDGICPEHTHNGVESG